MSVAGSTEDPAFAALSGSSRTAIQRMQEQFLPLDEFGVARIGVSRRSAFEEQVAALQPAGSRRGAPFYTAQLVDPVRLFDDPTTGLVLATATLSPQMEIALPKLSHALDWLPTSLSSS